MATWQVQLIDVGMIRIVDINQLWNLPEHFKLIPRQVTQLMLAVNHHLIHHLQVVEIFMYGVMPAAGNGSWSGEVSHISVMFMF